jgi:hypothetical protein
MIDYPDYVLEEDERLLMLGCKHCGGVVRVEGERGRAKMLFMGDHRLSCSWGHGPYSPAAEVQRRLESKLEQQRAARLSVSESSGGGWRRNSRV